MKRDQVTNKLIRIIKTIESGQTPKPIKKLWVFGSYARGALDCGDLDIAINFSEPDRDWYQKNAIKVYYPDCYEQFWKLMRDSIKKRGERIEILTINPNDFSEEKEGWHQDAVLIWDEDNPNNWQSAIDSILTDPDAERFQRNINLKRTGTTLEVWNYFERLVSKKCLTMKTVDMDSFQPSLTQEQSNWYERRISYYKKMNLSIKTFKLVPYAIDWLNNEKQSNNFYRDRAQIWSHDKSHFIHMGKIDFGFAGGWLCNFEEAKKLCLIPHLYKKSKNIMYIIERGPEWSSHNNISFSEN